MKLVSIEGPYCLVCGLDQEDDILHLTAIICFCCGTQYDVFEVDLDWIRTERRQWIDAGYPWFLPDRRPENWNPIEQLNQIQEKHR